MYTKPNKLSKPSEYRNKTAKLLESQASQIKTNCSAANEFNKHSEACIVSFVKAGYLLLLELTLGAAFQHHVMTFTCHELTLGAAFQHHVMTFTCHKIGDLIVIKLRMMRWKGNQLPWMLEYA